MKRTSILFLLCCIFLALPVKGQESGYQLFLVHEDVANIPNDYENELKQLNEINKRYSYPFIRMTAQMNGNRYLSFTPIDDIADMQRVSQALMEKMSDEDREVAVQLTNSHLESHSAYLLIHSDALSYVPDTADSSLANQNYRVVSFNYTVAGKETAVRELLLKWKALYEEKEIPYRYDVFLPGIGMDLTLVNIMWSGRDGEHVEQKFKHVQDLFDGANEALQQESTKYIRKTEEMRGVMRPDLDYYPPANN